MTGIAATPHTVSSVHTKRLGERRWRTTLLTALAVSAASVVICGLLAVSVALVPPSPTPDEMRLLQPAPEGATTVQIEPTH